MRQRILWPAVMPALLLTAIHGAAQAPVPATPMPGQVLVTGAVPDEASKAAMLIQLRACTTIPRWTRANGWPR
jgi:OOP family OmpA-OmpF porin